MIRSLVIACGLLGGLWVPAGREAAASLPQASQGEVAFTVDGALFRAPGDSLRQEIYLMLPATSLGFQPVSGSRSRAVYLTEMTLRDSLGKIQGASTWRREIVVTSGAEARDQRIRISDQAEFQLPGGLWQLTVMIRDSASGRSGTAKIPLRLSSFPSRQLSISDLEFASEVRSDTTGSIFTKNGYLVTPRADRSYGGKQVKGTLPVLSWYCEVYGLSPQASGAPGTFRMEYAVLDSSGKAVQEVAGEVRAKPGASVVEVGGMNVAGLPPGRYLLRVRAIDLDSKSEAVREGAFEKKPLEIVEGSLAVLPPPERETAAYYDQIQFLTTPDSVKFYRGLSPDGKKAWLAEFWARHDLAAFVANMKYVEDHFSSGFKKGRETDRGRIYLKYGKPDEITDHPADVQYPSHQIWRYYGQGGRQFVFSDLSGYGKYELIYSNVPGESSHPRWQTLFDSSELHK